MISNPVVIKKSGPPVGPASPKKVNFYDYDGTLLYSYMLSEARLLTTLPKGPIHNGLVFQGWNWTLEKVKSLIRPMNVGAVYVTNDSKTRLKIRIWDKGQKQCPVIHQPNSSKRRNNRLGRWEQTGNTGWCQKCQYYPLICRSRRLHHQSFCCGWV